MSCFSRQQDDVYDAVRIEVAFGRDEIRRCLPGSWPDGQTGGNDRNILHMQVPSRRRFVVREYAYMGEDE